MKKKNTPRRPRAAGRLEKALQLAAEDLFQTEIVQTEMMDLTIGPGLEYASREDWIQERIESWKKGQRTI